ncbi:hypothetical protein OESDEN_11304, partial [Oesophagostomum dentatum]
LVYYEFLLFSRRLTKFGAKWADWFCKYESPLKLLENNPYFFMAELLFIFLSALTFAHAYRHGGRYFYTWIAVTIFAFNMELLAITVPDLNISWHAQWADWFCKYESPLKLLENNPYFFMAELLFIFLSALTFAHAYRHGGRYFYTWIAVTICAFNMELLAITVPDLNISWHAQGVLSFFGMRVPLYALFGFHQMFIYTSYVLVSRMRLPWWAEGPGVGLSAMMLQLPFRILGTKMLWWTWHDTDPTIKERFPRETLSAFLAGVLSFWLGTMQFSLLYHPLHDFFKVHSEITTILFFAIYALLVFVADRNNNRTRYWFDELSCAVALEYIFLMVLVIIADPANIVSEVLHREKYLCATKYDEAYFDFHCVPNGVPKQQDDGSGVLLPLEFYPICGTDFKNRAEYITVIW